MKFINKLDEQNRFYGLICEISEVSESSNSHGFSYLHARNMYEELGDVMGLNQTSLKQTLKGLDKRMQTIYLGMHDVTPETDPIKKEERRTRE